MRVPLSWLTDYVDIGLAPRDLAERLTVLGFEVKGIEDGRGDWTGVVVGRVLEVQRHPNADTLWLTRVDVAGPEALAIVCGAQNLAVGQLVPVAVPGSVLPGNRRIERTKIRGNGVAGKARDRCRLEPRPDVGHVQAAVRGEPRERDLGKADGRGHPPGRDVAHGPLGSG